MACSPRIIRVRVKNSKTTKTIYSEDDPDGKYSSENKTATRFGGPLGKLPSQIFISSAGESLIYFDMIIRFFDIFTTRDLTEMFTAFALVPGAVLSKPTIGAVAIRLDSCPSNHPIYLSSAVSMRDPDLARLILVCSSNKLRSLANDSEDQWGFRSIDVRHVAERVPEEYKVSTSLIGHFNRFAGFEINYTYVI